jgi:glucose/arabinose dehydrogenase
MRSVIGFRAGRLARAPATRPVPGFAAILAASLVAGLAAIPAIAPSPALAQEQPAAEAPSPAAVRQGVAAYGDWTQSAPGLARVIAPSDLPAPYATQSSSNRATVVARPADAMPEVPDGFAVSLFADGLQGPRTLRVAPNGDVFVAESRAGRITVLRPDGSGGVAAKATFASGLGRPYGIAFYPPNDPQWVYVGEATRVVRFPYARGDTEASGQPEVVVADLPQGGHWTRDIAFTPDGQHLYISVGSGSNVAQNMGPASSDQIAATESRYALGAPWGSEAGRAQLLQADPDGANLRTFATGLRNCSGLAVQPTTGAPWCAVNERDGLGDDLPPDFVTRVNAGGFYGWPWYYAGANQDPRHQGERPDLADKVVVPDVLIQPHSAPLGMAFYDGTAFPQEYRGNAFVALHGSWNRDARTGYKVVRIPIANAQPLGGYVDFMTGFVLSADTVWGRPVGIAVATDGSLLVSEDAGGTIWRVTATPPDGQASD